jgi:hypothetical protein
MPFNFLSLFNMQYLFNERTKNTETESTFEFTDFKLYIYKDYLHALAQSNVIRVHLFYFYLIDLVSRE